eukprot:11655189-Ditylum_brightwellii.AAC.1
MMQLQRITLARMFDEDTIDDMDLNFIDVQLMRIIVTSSTHGTISAHIWHLRMIDKYFELLNYINQFVQFINEKDGWTVVGQYKHSVINDCALVGNNGSAPGSYNNNRQ